MTVDDDGGADFTSIQEAIDSPTTFPDDEIRVNPGTYAESVNVYKRLTIEGNDPSDTIINGGGEGNVVNISVSGVVVSNFKVTGSGEDGSGIRLINVGETMISYLYSTGNYYGISLLRSDGNTITNCNLSHNIFVGLYLKDSDLNHLSRITASHNINAFPFTGTGIRFVQESDQNIIEHCDCSDNYGYGIYISESRENIVSDSRCAENTLEGIRLFLADNSKVERCTVSNNSESNGIGIYSSNNNNVVGNNCSGNHDHGIRTWSDDFYGPADNNTIENNICMQNGKDGIHIPSCDNTLRNNVCSRNLGNGISNGGRDNGHTNNTCHQNSGSGILLTGNGHKLVNSRLRDNGNGIYLKEAANAYLNDNHMEGNGIHITGDPHDYYERVAFWNTHSIDTSNTVNGKPVYYFKNATDAVIPKEAGQLILANCKDTIVEGLNCSNVTVGIGIGYSSNITLDHNTCNDNVDGIFIEFSDNIVMTDNELSFHKRDGIRTFKSYTISLSGNIMDHAGFYGFFPSMEQWFTLDIDETNTLNGKPLLLYKNKTGIKVPSDGGQVIMVNCSHIVLDGLDCSYGSNGIMGTYSSNITVTNSRCSSNSNVGISFAYSESLIIRDNTCDGNRKGIYIYGNYSYPSENNSIENNSCEINVNGIECNYMRHSIIANNTCSSNSQGLKLFNCIENILVKNICDSNKWEGMFLHYNEQSLILDNYCTGNRKFGIALFSSKHLRIDGNTCDGNGYCGIKTVYSHYLEIFNNSCQRNNDVDGIYQYRRYGGAYGTEMRATGNPNCGISLYGDYGTVVGNNCSGNGYYGIYVYGKSNVITRNAFSGNRLAGVFLFYQYAENNSIDLNTISDNGVGILLWWQSDDNSAHNNTIVGNHEYGIHVEETDDQTFNATNNWWGNPSGPFHHDTNNDGMGDSVSDHVEFQPWLQEPVANENTAPTIITESVEIAHEDSDYSVTYTATDDEGDTLSWYLATNAGFLGFDSGPRHLHGIPAQEDIGTYYVNVTVSDGELIDFRNFTLEVKNVNDGPIIISTDIIEWFEDIEYSNVYEAEDEDGDPLEWTLSTDAHFLSIDPNLGHLSGIPAQEDVGISWVNVSVSDGWLEDCHNFTLEVVNVNDDPIVTILEPLKWSTIQGEITIWGTAEDEDGDECIETVELFIDGNGWESASGTTSWSYDWDTTLHSNGMVVIQVRAYDGKYFSDIQEITVNVSNSHENIIPEVFLHTPLPDTEVSDDVFISGSASDKDGEIMKVELSIDGGSWFVVTGTETWAYSWDSKSVENGLKTISVRSFDGEVYSIPGTIKVTVNNEEEKDDDHWYDNPLFIGTFAATIIVIVVVVVLFIRKRNENFYNDWYDEDYYEDE